MPTEVFSDEARQAEKRFGIEPHRVFSLTQGKQMSDEIFLGVAFTSGTEEVVIPFFDRGLPVEYELTRSIRVVSKSGRKKVGILTTDAKLTGGMDMRTFSQTPGMVDRHGAQKAIRRELGLAGHADRHEPGRAAGGAAVVADSKADRQPDRLRQEGRSRRCSSSIRSRLIIRRCRPRCPSSLPGACSAAGSRRSPRAT